MENENYGGSEDQWLQGLAGRRGEYAEQREFLGRKICYSYGAIIVQIFCNTFIKT